MQYRNLGRTGVQVSSLALGAMNFGAIGRTTQDEVTALVDAAIAGGINLIDDRLDVHHGWGTSATTGGARAAGCSPPWTTACAASVSTTSISSRSTGGTRPPATRRRCPR